VIDNKKGVVSKKKSVRTPENIHRVQQALTQSPRKSVKRLCHQLNFGASSTYRIIREDVKLFPYRIPEADKAKRVRFCGDVKIFWRTMQQFSKAHGLVMRPILI
jgi:hypothetical protein